MAEESDGLMETPTSTSCGKKNITSKTGSRLMGKKVSRKEGIPAGMTRQQVMPKENWWKFVGKDKRRAKKEKKRLDAR